MFASQKASLARFCQISGLLAILLMCATVTFGQAQSKAADVQGEVTDSTGAVVANATVTARNPGTNISRSTTTNDEGRYRILNLPPSAFAQQIKATKFT